MLNSGKNSVEIADWLSAEIPFVLMPLDIFVTIYGR